MLTARLRRGVALVHRFPRMSRVVTSQVGACRPRSVGVCRSPGVGIRRVGEAVLPRCSNALSGGPPCRLRSDAPWPVGTCRCCSVGTNRSNAVVHHAPKRRTSLRCRVGKQLQGVEIHSTGVAMFPTKVPPASAEAAKPSHDQPRLLKRHRVEPSSPTFNHVSSSAFEPGPTLGAKFVLTRGRLRRQG